MEPALLRLLMRWMSSTGLSSPGSIFPHRQRGETVALIGANGAGKINAADVYPAAHCRAEINKKKKRGDFTPKRE